MKQTHTEQLGRCGDTDCSDKDRGLGKISEAHDLLPSNPLVKMTTSQLHWCFSYSRKLMKLHCTVLLITFTERSSPSLSGCSGSNEPNSTAAVHIHGDALSASTDGSVSGLIWEEKHLLCWGSFKGKDTFFIANIWVLTVRGLCVPGLGLWLDCCMKFTYFNGQIIQHAGK